MSGRRLFDVQPRRRRAAPEPEKKKNPKKRPSHPRLSQRASRRPLRERRQEESMRTFWLWCAGIALIAGATLYGLWRPEVRISEVRVDGDVSAETLRAIAEEELVGTEFGVIPRDSFFFYPEEAIRLAVLDRYPAVSAVSIGRSGFTSLTLSVSPRVSAFWWCGAPDGLSASSVSCYEADAEGLVFARAELSPEARTTEMLLVYAELEGGSASANPIRSRVVGASMLPDILKFVRFIEGLGIPVASVAIRADEADLFIVPSTRVTYVIGHEEEARKNAEAAFPTLNLVDGSLEYIDLRFDGKVYLKRTGE